MYVPKIYSNLNEGFCSLEYEFNMSVPTASEVWNVS
jgi:hypothetical protein